MSQPNRRFEIGLGLVCAVCAAGLLALGAAIAGVAFVRGGALPSRVFWLAIAALAWGALFALLSWRLILNRPRRDGGLLSPLALRLAGALMALSGHGTGGLFDLARRREGPDTAEPPQPKP